ncbi:MAG: hypothetical protein ACRC6M_15210 [Microcystaceae cyanobacterium]
MTKTLIRLERCSHRFLASVPPSWRSLQQGVHQSRIGYQRLAKQLWLLQNVIGIIGFLANFNQSFLFGETSAHALTSTNRSPKIRPR